MISKTLLTEIENEHIYQISPAEAVDISFIFP